MGQSGCVINRNLCFAIDWNVVAFWEIGSLISIFFYNDGTIIIMQIVWWEAIVDSSSHFFLLLWNFFRKWWEKKSDDGASRTTSARCDVNLLFFVPIFISRYLIERENPDGKFSFLFCFFLFSQQLWLFIHHNCPMEHTNYPTDTDSAWLLQNYLFILSLGKRWFAV